MSHLSFQKSAMRIPETLADIGEFISKQSNEWSYDALHARKSILYAAIERINTDIEVLTTIQRGLRELLVLVTSLPESNKIECLVGRQIIDELTKYSSRISLGISRSKSPS